MRNLAIIPARGGSKRIPGKNIRPFLGKPIIAYSIETAISSGIFDEIMVSTDDPEIARIALTYGASVPFMRSPENADDHATTAAVLTEVLTQYADRGQQFTMACCIYPTAPLITTVKLSEAYRKLRDSDADSVVPITAFSFPIWRSFQMNDAHISFNWPEYALTRSQDLPVAYHDAGQFYFFRVERFLQTHQLISSQTLGLEIPEMEAQDIDNENDWKMAEFKYRIMHQI